MLIPVVLSGGAGTRLWPVSREGHPKPFMRLPDGQSLLAKTYQRARALSPEAEILTLTHRDFYFGSRDELHRVAPGAAACFMLEPFGRNTAAALALGAFYLLERFGDAALMLALPADHLIEDLNALALATRDAARLARQGHLVTFGVAPSQAETGFGYIEKGEAIAGSTGFTVRRFVEKPDAATAAAYLAGGRHLWNSGMLCCAAGALLDGLRLHAPELLDAAQACWQASRAHDSRYANSHMIEVDAESLAALPDISIDYALLERSDKSAVIPARFDWNDIGSWNAVAGLFAPDGEGNRVVGDEVLLVDAHHNFIQAESRVVAAVGVDDLYIVDTADALLVAHRDAAQQVREVARRLKDMAHESYRLHRTVLRPWGTYTVLEEGEGFKIKRIEVRPGGCLSLQKHHHRSEHWIVVSGIAEVSSGEQTFLVNTNESTFIPAGHPHRLKNPGVLDLVMIEVQSGNYLGEDDIVRLEDDYGRVRAG